MAAPKEGGFKISLGGLKGKPGFKAKGATQTLAKRPRPALDDEADDDDSNKHQEISGFDLEGGVMDVNGKSKEKEGPLIIPALPNRNWGERMRKERLEKEAAQKQNADDAEQTDEKKVEFGLTFAKKEIQEDTEVKDSAPIEASEPKDELTDEQRLEKNALAALLNDEPTDEHVIPIQTEEEAFRNDMKEAPDAPTLEAYEATPIEGFGAALLRGMGWKDGQSIGRNGAPAKQVEIKRRPALLGIGAKEEAAVGVELGEWGKGKKSKAVQSYNPIALKNKNTGEILTEEELKAKIESQSMLKDDKPSKSSSSKYADEGDERRRDKRDRRRDDEYDSERRRDRERRDDRRREGDEKYYDSDRRREKRRDRDDEYYDSERRREKKRDKDRRDRSRSPDERREKRRERDRRERSGSRDSDYRREKRRDRDRDRRDRSRSRDSEDRRKRRRDREHDYEDERDDRKRRHKDDKYSRR